MGSWQASGDKGFLSDFKETYYRSPADTADEDPPTLLKVGNRIMLSFGMPAMWYGGFVAMMEDEITTIAFDDGDLKMYPQNELQGYATLDTLRGMDASAGGLVANEGGYAMAAAVTYFSPGGKAAAKPVGVLVGETDVRLGDVPIYQQHVVQSDAFKPAPGRRASRAGSGTTQSERGGWHTFCKGDMVTLTTGGDKKPLEPRESAHAFVYGVTYHENEKGHGRKQQGRKILVLYEDPSQVFFLAYPTRWKRMPRGGSTGNFDPDELGAAVAQMSSAQCMQMNEDFSASLYMQSLQSVSLNKLKTALQTP